LILLTSVTQAAQFLLHGAMSAFMPLYAREAAGLTPIEIGWLLAGQTSTTLLARPLVAAVADRSGRRRLIAAGLTASSGAVILLSIAGSGSAIAVAVLAYALGAAITTAASGAFITDLARRAHYGTAHGVFGSIYDIGDASGPLLGGLLAAAVGYAWMFRAAGLAGLTMAAMFLAAARPAGARTGE
jgi:MFS family permease